MTNTTETTKDPLFNHDDLDKIKQNSLHYYALACTGGWYEGFNAWNFKKFFFKPGTGLYNRAKAVVTYDRILNNEKRLEKNLEENVF